jgi:hypothetical protein
MNTTVKKDTQASENVLTEFNVQVCSNDGRLLSEYSLTGKDHDVRTLAAAENSARTNLSDHHGEPLVVVVTEQTLTRIHQVHIRVVANSPNWEE